MNARLRGSHTVFQVLSLNSSDLGGQERSFVLFLQPRARWSCALGLVAAAALGGPAIGVPRCACAGLGVPAVTRITWTCVKGAEKKPNLAPQKAETRR